MLSALLAFQGTWGRSANPTPHFWAMLSSSYVAVPEEDALPSISCPWLCPVPSHPPFSRFRRLTPESSLTDHASCRHELRVW